MSITAVEPDSEDKRDANHDGQINFAEFLSSASSKDSAKDRFEMFDANKDGAITLSEFLKSGKK